MEDDSKTVPAKRRKPGRPAGSRTKPKTGLVKGQLRDFIGANFSESDVKRLSPESKARLLTSLEPKEKPETPGNFTLVVAGLKGWICEKCGHRQTEKAAEGLPAKAVDAAPAGSELRLIGEPGSRVSWEGEQ